MNLRNSIAALLWWRRKHRQRLTDERFVLLIALIVGVCTAFAGIVLKWIIHEIKDLLTYNFSDMGANWLYLVFPAVGILITLLFIKYIVRDDISHGVTKILFAIARKQSKIKLHNTWTSVVASAITIGFGGSVGAEAPIVLTGSAIGSNLGRLFRLSDKQMMLLVGCGAAGAVAGIFKAPIAGLVFVLEVLMIDLTMSSLLPLLVSCVTAAAVTFAISGTESIFYFTPTDGLVVGRTPAYILLGVACGLIALYFTRTMNWLEGRFRKIGSTTRFGISGQYRKYLFGASMLALLIFLFPSLYGEGYELIELLMNGRGPADWNTAMNGSFFAGHSQYLLLYLALVILTKVFASTATNGAARVEYLWCPGHPGM